MLLPSLMLMLMGGGMAVDESVPAEISVLIYGIVNYISITLCTSFTVNTLGYDERSGWIKTQRAMPVTGGQIIGAKFAAMGLVLVLFTLISLILNIIAALLFGIPLEPMLALPLCMCMVQAITLSPTIALGYRFGARATSAAYILLMIVTAVAMIFLTFAVFMGDIGAAALRIICYAGVPVLTAVVITISRLAGKKAVSVDI